MAGSGIGWHSLGNKYMWALEDKSFIYIDCLAMFY